MDYPRYDPQSAVTPLTAAELQGLDTLLQSLPVDGAMSVDGLDGYLTALLLRPVVPAEWDTAGWLPAIWGGDGDAGPEAAAPFASKRQRKATVVLVLRHLRHLRQQLFEAPDDWEPVFSVAEQGEREWVDARDWCTGFLQAVDLLPGAWGDALAAPALAPLLKLGGGLGGGDTTAATATTADDFDDPATCDALSRAVPEAVLLLRNEPDPR